MNLQSRDYPFLPVQFTDVTITDTFWSRRIAVNQNETIPFAFQKCEETGRIANFAKAGGLVENDRKHSGCPFDDSDVFKVIEGAAFALSVHRDPVLEAYVDDIIVKIEAAQEEDGYLYTDRTMKPDDPHEWASPERWKLVKELSHELYNAGHFYESAVAYYLATGKRRILDIAIKNADLIDLVYGPGKNEDAPGHQEIEVGLVKLYRVTGEDRYLELAKFFLDTRGPDGGEYSQAHKKVLDQDEAVGHAVRGTYMYSAMADVAALTGDEQYLAAIDRIWDNVVSRKMYITGGIGSTHGGEAFGKNYELPNMSAYCETCASIANVYWNHRLFLLHGAAKYIDVLERTLYNALIAGVDMDGKKFFYPNPLSSIGQHKRSPWFGCSCCPTNVTRFMASIPHCVYARRDMDVYVNLFVSSEAATELNGTALKLSQQTGYPWDGTVRIDVTPERPVEGTIAVRLPGWALNQPVPSDLYRFMDTSEEPPTVKVNGEPVALDLHDGYVRLNRTWQADDVIMVELPMPVRRVVANENVEEDRGMVAIQRGPIVFCAEWPDNDGHAWNLFIPDEDELTTEFRPELLNGVQTVSGTVLSLKRAEDEVNVIQEEVQATWIPYYAWAHRGTGEMAVWLPREMTAAKPLAGPSIASTSEITVSRDAGAKIALCDQMEPKHSNDHSMPYLHWWPNMGSSEWAEYSFNEPKIVSRSELYWFDDGPWGGCRVPESWQLRYKAGDEWLPVETTGEYAVSKDRWNTITFSPVATTGLRLNIQFQKDVSGGILEWKVK